MLCVIGFTHVLCNQTNIFFGLHITYVNPNTQNNILVHLHETCIGQITQNIC
jgi:hypothetical protein